MKSFLSRTFVNGNGNAGFLGEHDYGTVRFKTTEDVERQARMMFLTGRRVDEPDAKEPSRTSRRRRRRGSTEPRKRRSRRRRPSSAPGPSWSSWRSSPAIAISSPGRSSIASGTGSSATAWSCRSTRCTRRTRPAIRSCWPGWPATLVEHGYDLRRLIRGLVLSRAYARSSRWEGGGAARPSLFAVAARAALDADATGDLAAAGDRRPGEPAAGLPVRTVREADRGPGGRAPARSPRRSRRRATTPRSAWPRRCSSATVSGSPASCWPTGRTGWSAVSKQTAGPAELIDLAVRNVLSRPPDDEEVRTLDAYLAERTDRPDEACRQLVWALLTSSEFRFNH